MEMELNSLIERIKKDGVAEAGKRADEITSEAEQKAKDTVARAEDQAKEIISKAEKETADFKNQSQESIKQALRDTLLMLKQKITVLFDEILTRKVSEQLTPEFLKEIIVKMVENFQQSGILDVEVLTGKEDKKKLEQITLDALTEKMRQGVTFKVLPSLESGFRIGKKGDNYYYDLTGPALAEALSLYLNPQLQKYLDTDKKDG